MRPDNPWPRLMRAPTAAAYCDEPSAAAFRRRVGTVYPQPVTSKGQRAKWDREQLDAAIDAMNPTAPATGETLNVFDAANVL